MPWDDPDIDDGLEPEGPSADDLDHFGDEFIRCPNCDKAIYDQAEVCPFCGEGVADRVYPVRLWVAVVVGLILIAFVVSLFR